MTIAPSIYERTDDSNGAIGDIMSLTVRLIETVSPQVKLDAETLAHCILDAVIDAGYGEFDGIIPATKPILGNEGLEHLKQITREWSVTPATERELERYKSWGFGTTTPEELVERNRKTSSSIILADIADAQDDVDAYMARYTDEQLTYGTIAPGIARRLLDAERVDEAMDIINRSREAESGKAFRTASYDLEAAYEECLEKLGRTDELKQHLWDTFEQTLSKQCLQKYLKLLPDFEDIEVEDRALAHAERYPRLGGAINFLISWPALSRAAKTIEIRAAELDGDSYYTLTEAANTLAPEYPLAATLMRRVMVQHTLNGGKSKRYRYAAQHLSECADSDAAISDYGDFISHDQFVAKLREKHPRKHGFWGLVDG